MFILFGHCFLNLLLIFLCWTQPSTATIIRKVAIKFNRVTITTTVNCFKKINIFFITLINHHLEHFDALLTNYVVLYWVIDNNIDISWFCCYWHCSCCCCFCLLINGNDSTNSSSHTNMLTLICLRYRISLASHLLETSEL